MIDEEDQIDGCVGQGTQQLLLLDVGKQKRPTGVITGKKVRQLIEFQRYKCALSGWDLTPDIASLDHIVPLARGGDNCMDNVQVLHTIVNRAKGSTPMEEFIFMCKTIAHRNP